MMLWSGICIQEEGDPVTYVAGARQFSFELLYDLLHCFKHTLLDERRKFAYLPLQFQLSSLQR